MSDEMILSVNGKPHAVRAAPDTPLLYVLRNELGLIGPHFGCGEEKCGACMVLIGDQARQSCKLPVSEVGRTRVTTLEGLTEEGELHPVQQAFIDEQAAQCGFCTSGIIVSAAALLDKNPKPTETQVRAALDRNLCRCGSHNRMVRAVLRASSS